MLMSRKNCSFALALANKGQLVCTHPLALINRIMYANATKVQNTYYYI